MRNSASNRFTGKRCAHVESIVIINACCTHGELVVDFVDVFVDLAVMQRAMQEVVPGVFDDSTAKALSQDERPEGGEPKKRVI